MFGRIWIRLIEMTKCPKTDKKIGNHCVTYKKQDKAMIDASLGFVVSSRQMLPNPFFFAILAQIFVSFEK